MHLTRKLVPQKLLLSLLEAADFAALKDLLYTVPEGENSEGISNFAWTLINRMVERQFLPHDLIRQYDENIRRHTRFINDRRSEPIQWKYFQYLALLFTEIYLDRFFRDPNGLCGDMNAILKDQNAEMSSSEQLPLYSVEDLTKLAFLQATGSGKTLQLHINILQYLHYRKQAGERPPDRVILLTPNEGLSHQHLAEAAVSGFNAEIFNKDKPSDQSRLGVQLDIIDIHKLEAEAGDKTVAVDSFEGNNLLLVDEGHRGASGVDWMEKRAKLCAGGFSFEYSATFTQAVNAASGAKRKELEALYARCILFDYSYKWFHGDGFGKDYRIRNLCVDTDRQVGQDEQRELYLTAGLLGYYQQLRLYQERRDSLRPYQIEEPLLVFVGSKVTKIFNQQEAADVVEVVKFLDRITRDRDVAIRRIALLLGDTPALTNTEGVDLFQRAFEFLRESGDSPEAHYQALLRTVFNGTGTARIHADLLKGADGEIGLKLGDGDYFGVVNVGEAKKLHDLLTEEKISTSSREFSESLFRNINDSDSPIKILMGSKKFSEGWSSYRVSAMGLLNVGRTEGTQIIQLFGRGVRLKGYGMSLKRSDFSGVPKSQRPPHLRYLETLTIFGIRADFMTEFKRFLELEGMSADPEASRITMPVLANLPANTKLKALGLPPGVSFKLQGPYQVLSSMPDPIFRRRPVEVNWYPRIQQVLNPNTATQAGGTLQPGKLEQRHLGFLDMHALYEELLEYKLSQGWNTLVIPPDAPATLLSKGASSEDWYTLFIPQTQLAFDTYAKRYVWQEIATVLLRKYLDLFYKSRKAAWENKRMVYRDITLADLEKTYSFDVAPDNDPLISDLTALKAAIETGKLSAVEAKKAALNGLQLVTWEGSLFQPLIFVKEAVLRLSSLALRESERDFVIALVAYAKSNPKLLKGKEIYLLRNETKHRGIGFFDEGGFFPDFLLWIVDGSMQHVCFVDPHGLGRETTNSPKIRLAKTIKTEHEQRLADPDIRLESFILSPTPYNGTTLFDGGWTIETCTENHVLFMDRSDYIQSLFRLALD
jgi:hypothetical protein